MKTGYITIEVEDVVKAMDGVAGIAKELGGYVVSSNKHEDEDVGLFDTVLSSEDYHAIFENVAKPESAYK